MGCGEDGTQTCNTTSPLIEIDGHSNKKIIGVIVQNVHLPAKGHLPCHLGYTYKAPETPSPFRQSSLPYLSFTFHTVDPSFTHQKRHHLLVSDHIFRSLS